MEPLELDLPLVFKVLRDLGYTLEVLPAAGGKRVVARSGLERWEGRGAGTRPAMDAVLDQMFPSAATRAALRIAVEAIGPSSPTRR